jgi:hypothetical protein
MAARRALAPVADRMAALLAQQLTRRVGTTRHLPTCRLGYWVDGYSWPHGAPCSARCAAIRAVLDEYARQPALFAEGA